MYPFNFLLSPDGFDETGVTGVADCLIRGLDAAAFGDGQSLLDMGKREGERLIDGHDSLMD
jgi:hypothetical protein